MGVSPSLVFFEVVYVSAIMDYTRGSHNPLNIARTLLYRLRFIRRNPNYFWPSGIWVFVGPQGAGKTLSAVKCLKEIVSDYPRCKVVSNIDLVGFDRPVIPFTDYSQLSELNNGTDGIVFFLDEIHVLWGSLESKDIPVSEMACFCQMRKARRVIIGTSQVYGRIAKPIREQLQYVIDCRNYFGLLQVNKILDPVETVEKDGHIDPKVLGRRIWLHTPDLYGSYDTLYKVNKALRRKGGK